LKRTGDYFYIENLLGKFEETIKEIERTLKNKVPSIQLYTTNLMKNIQHLHALISIVDIPAAHLFLRNLLESFVKFFVYYDVRKFINNPNLFLSSMFLYEYEATVKALKSRALRTRV